MQHGTKEYKNYERYFHFKQFYLNKCKILGQDKTLMWTFVIIFPQYCFFIFFKFLHK